MIRVIFIHTGKAGGRLTGVDTEVSIISNSTSHSQTSGS